MKYTILLMAFSQEKQDLYDSYINNYTPENRLAFCQLALKKYRFEKYKLSENEINNDDLIVQDNYTRNCLHNIINYGECSVEDFYHIFDKLSIDQINYIGF
jgi:hypothetical protein